MAKVKLTKAQRIYLGEIEILNAKGREAQAAFSYKPAAKLVELGLVGARKFTYSWFLRINDAGRKWLGGG